MKKNFLRKAKVILGLLIIFIIVIVAAISCSEKEKSIIQQEGPVEIAGLTSCIVFDNEEYCKKGEALWGDPDILPIGFNLPEGTKIYSPVDGVLEIFDAVFENGQVGKVIHLTERPMEEGYGNFIFHGIVPNPDLEKDFKEGSGVEMVKVRKGELIGETAGEIFLHLFAKDYNFVIMINNIQNLPPYTEKYPPIYFIDMEYLHQFFAYIKYEKSY